MNILREIRKLKKRSLRVKVWLILIFLIMLISSAYAWSAMQAKGGMTDLIGVVNAWGVEFFVNDEEILDETATFSVDEFFPGMKDLHEVLKIYNMGSRATTVSVKVTSVKLFGEEILPDLEENLEIKDNGTTINLFTDKTKYPFDVSIRYKKDLAANMSGEENEENTGTVDFDVLWRYEADNDDLDTEFGKKAYTYYKENSNTVIDDSEEETVIGALEVVIEVTAVPAK